MTPDGLQAAGSGPRAPVAHGPQPRPGLLADAVGEAVELAVQPALEGGAPVIDQHAHLLEHLGGPSGADVPGPQCREDLGVADSVPGGVPGQHDDQRPADTQADPAFPAASLPPPVGQVDRPDEPRVLQAGVVVLAETGEIPADFEQPRLEPPDGRSRGERRRRFARSAPPAVLTGRPSARRPFIRSKNSWWQRSVPACRTETAPRGSPPASWDSRRACCQHNRQWPSLTASTRPHPEHCCSPG